MVKNLKLLRNKKQISQQQLADLVGVSQQSINKYENHGVEPDIATLIHLADIFETSVDYLIGHTDIAHKIENVEAYELNAEEAAVIARYRRLNERQRRSVMAVMESYTA